MWSHDVISTSIGLAGDLKIGQYLKIPPRVMFLTRKLLGLIFLMSMKYSVYLLVEIWGVILGMFN